MSQPKCSCESFERLEGASVPAYIKAFLDQAGRSVDERNLYRCRACGRKWEKRPPQTKTGGGRPSLIRLEDKG
ncbi:MAG TPA: hypothetical protein VGX92_11315 [Pyrinomonadaceae bacterium]|nr:hypothetical protein [Pyrinomonadaceae bacterium]